jgi:DNA-binding MarR family transcriptional regulator
MTAETGVLAHELRDTVGRLIRRLRAERGQLPVHQLAVLGRLERDGPAGTSDLAAAEHMRPQSMAQTVRDLEAAGLLVRRPDPGDGRRALLELTDAGREQVLGSRASRESWLDDVIERELSPAEQERLREALALLARIADA